MHIMSTIVLYIYDACAERDERIISLSLSITYIFITFLIVYGNSCYKI